jgi:O-antigen/teichoic acid export membrane protein
LFAELASSLRGRRAAREALWVGAGQLLAAVGSLIALRVLTGLLGRHEFGVLALALTVPTLLANVIFAGPGQAVMRFYVAAAERGESRGLLRAVWSALVLRSVLVLAFAAAVSLVGALVGLWHLRSYALAAVVIALITAFTTAFDGIQNALRQRSVVAWHAVLNQWARLFLALALFAVFGRTGLVAMWGYALAIALVLASQVMLYRRHARREPSTGTVQRGEWRQRIDSYSLPFAAFGIVVWAQAAAERWGLEAFTSTAQVGEFAALSQLGLSVMALLGNVVTQLGLPVIYQRAGDATVAERMRSARSLNRQLVVLTLAATAVAAVGAALFHGIIFGAFVDSAFMGVSHLLPVMVLAGGLTACGQIAMGFVLSGVSSQPLVRPKVLAAAIGVIAAIAGAWWAGVAGVVWANAVSALVYLVALAFVVRRGTGVVPPHSSSAARQ